ncbi:MAG TPA: Gfo/Idh/MocA family oxidoreductase [Anaerolineales bacterium]|nr:Gfo/Idh/MocA family oxidoreductase [Anaerolineales bacterium]
MQNTSPVRMAVAGLSHGHVTWLLRRWQRPDVDLVGIAEADQALSARYATEFGLPRERLFNDLETMLDAVTPEAVCAFGSIYDHLSVVEACAPRRIHVMVEKPLAVNGEHARRMAELARGSGIHLITNYETTWYASTYEARRLALEAGVLGPLRKVVVHDGHWGPVEIGCNPEFLAWLTDPVLNGGGAVVDFGCYGANLITWLMDGAEPETVTAVLQTLKPDVYPRVDDEATILLTYPGMQGVIQGSWNWPYHRKDMELYGSDGYAIAATERRMRVGLRAEESERVYELQPAPEPVNDPFAYFAAVVRGAEVVTPGNLWSLENALTVVTILDAARLSAREGRTVSLTKRAG